MRTFVDASFAILLAAVLLGVYLADRRGASTRPVDQGPVEEPIVVVPEPVPIKLAVTPAGFDDMGKLLGTLGDGYRFEVVPEKTLADPAACARFDAIFLTCARAGGPGGADDPARLAPALRQFVENGGTLYASDLRFDTLATAFPELVDHEAVAQGLKQDLRAQVVAAELADLIGGELPLHFDLDGWRPGAFRGDPVTVYLKGRFRTTAGDTIDAPLLVKFPFGKGTVLFTSFHNEKQNNATEVKLLKHLVFSTVTARLEATVTRSMVRGGFSLQQSNLLSATPGEPSMTKSYPHAQPGGLAFTLGFEPRGARLRLEVVSPRGERFVKKGDSTLTVDIPDAVAGSWTYTATPESLPYPNFPFTLSVGAAGKPAADVARAAPPRTRARASGSVRFREVLVGEVAVQAGPKRIAVTEPRFDDMGKLLRTLGDGYAYKTIPEDDLLRPESLDRFDILFLTCDGWPTAWAESLGPAHDREGISVGTARPDVIKRFKETIQRFVNRGGTLYASDLRDEMVLWAFPKRMAVLELDTTPLANLDILERSWLEAKAPLAGVGTVAETLKAVQLSPALLKDVDRLIAAIEITDMVKVGPNPPDRDVEATVDRLLWAVNLTATDADIKAIAAALSDWERRIRESARSRPRGKAARSQAQIAQHERQMQAVRDRILRDARGVKEQTVTARIIEPGLRELIGPEISLNFNTEAWVPARFRGDDVVEYIRGEYQAMQGRQVEAPLLVKFKEGQGTVIFTSFHNEAQNSRQEEALLKYLVFSAVTAREQEVADKAMFSGGFSPAKRSLISHSSGQPSVTKLYQSPRPGPLRFSLTFAGQGALIKLSLVAPTGDLYEKEARGTLVVEADGATAGEWRYTVTALRVPHENFPFSVSVGEGTAPPGR